MQPKAEAIQPLDAFIGGLLEAYEKDIVPEMRQEFAQRVELTLSEIETLTCYHHHKFQW